MNLFKQFWVRGVRRTRDEIEDAQNDIKCAHPLFRYGFYVVVSYFFIAIGVGIYWSSTPAKIDVIVNIHHQVAILKSSSKLNSSQKLSLPSQELSRSTSSSSAYVPAGVATTSTLIAVSETLLDKSGGYISNDIFPPGVWLDNMPHWEFGVLVQVRDTTKMLRASLSQTSLNPEPDVDLQKAEVRLNFSNTSWSFPATESQYRAGIEHLNQYNIRLIQSSDAHFYNDAQHLNDYLASVEQRLKNLSQRLTASVGPHLNTDAAAMSVKQVDAQKIVSALYTKTPWWQIDDIFYEARGSSWALIALLQGIEIDFSDTLQQQNAQASFEQIIRELKPTQQIVFSPIILNGDGFGLVANHSLTMASYLARAQAAVSDCRRQLQTIAH